MRVFGISKAMGRRSVPRAKAPVEALLCTKARDHAVELIDLSRTGARLAGVCFLAQGQPVTLRVDRLRAHGEVIWVADKECGVEFDTPIAAEEVNRVRSVANLLSVAVPESSLVKTSFASHPAKARSGD